jgi:hypothetical protein
LLRFLQALEVWPGAGDGGVPVGEGPDVPPGLGPILVKELESGEGEDAVEQVVVGETEADGVVCMSTAGP